MKIGRRRFFPRVVVIGIEVAVVAVLITAILGGLRFVRDRMDEVADQFGEKISAQISDHFGVTITYGRVMPSALSSLQVQDLELRDSGGTLILSADRLRLHYSIQTLLSTRNAFEAVGKVEVTGVIANLILPRDRMLIIAALSGISAPSTGAEMVPNRMLPWPLDVSEAQININNSKNDRVELSNLSFHLEPKAVGKEIHMRGQSDLAVSVFGTNGDSTMDFMTGLHIDGILDNQTSYIEAAVHVDEIHSSFGTLSSQEILATWDGRVIQLQTGNSQGPLTVKVTTNPAGHIISFDVVANELRPLRVFKPSGPISNLNEIFENDFSGTATVVVDTSVADVKKAVTYSGTVSFAASPKTIGNIVDRAVHITVTANGDLHSVNVSPLIFNTTEGAVNFTGSINLPDYHSEGFLKVSGFKLDGRPIEFVAEIEADVPKMQVKLQDGIARIGDETVSAIDGQISLSGLRSKNLAELIEPVLMLDIDGTLSGVTYGNGEVKGSIKLVSEPIFSGSIKVNKANVGTLYRLLNTPIQRDPKTLKFIDDLILTAKMEGRAARDDLEIAISAASIAQVNGPLKARFNALVTGEQLRIADIDLWFNDTVRAYGSADISKEKNLSFVGRVVVDGEELPGIIELDAKNGVRLRGPYGLVLDAWSPTPLSLNQLFSRIFGITEGEPIPFKMVADGYPLIFLSDQTTATARLTGTLSNPMALITGMRAGAHIDIEKVGLTLSSSYVVLHDIPIGDRENELEINFDYQQDVIIAERFKFINDELVLTGDGDLSWPDGGGLSASGHVVLQAGQERYEAAVNIVQDHVHLEIDVHRLPLHRLGDLPISGTASGQVQVIGSVANPIIHAVLTSEDARFSDDDLSLAIAVTYDGEILAINDLSLDYKAHHLRALTGNISMGTNAISLSGYYEGKYLGSRVAMDLAIDGETLNAVLNDDFSSTWFPMEARLGIVATGVMVDEVPRSRWKATVHLTDGELLFSGGPIDGLAGNISADGSFAVTFSDPLPLQGVASGTLLDNNISAEVAVNALDLTVLNDLINTSVVNILAGEASGSLRLSGLVNDPDLFGVLQATGVVAESTLSPDSIGPVTFALVADEKDLVIGRTRPQGSVVGLTVGGKIRIARWSPISFDMDVLTTGPEGMAIDYRFGPISIDGTAHGRLKISGDDMGTRVAGTVTAQNANVFVDNTNQRKRHREPLAVDLRVVTGRGVELAWPSQDLPILHTLLDNDQAVEIRYDGFTGDFSVVGDVEIRGGDLFFYNRSFYLKEGMVSFSEDENRFDPLVVVRAETREYNQSAGSLRIYLDTDTRLSSLSPQAVRVSSEPPRPPSELVAMLGAPFGGSVAGHETDLLALAGGVVSQFRLVRPVERAVRESFGLDLFSIRSELVENLLRTPLGIPSIDIFDNTTIVVGKYLGDDVFFEALVRVESDDVSLAPELHTDLELSLEWSTPFFLLEWSLLPSLTDVFLTDNSLSLSWNFNY